MADIVWRLGRDGGEEAAYYVNQRLLATPVGDFAISVFLRMPLRIWSKRLIAIFINSLFYFQAQYHSSFCSYFSHGL